MNTLKVARKTHHSRILGLALAAILLGAPSMALALDQNFNDINSNTALNDALNGTAGANDAGHLADNKTINLTGHIGYTPASDSLAPAFSINSGGISGGIMAAPITGNITINGNGHTIYRPIGTTTTSPAFSIINAKNQINLNALTIKGAYIKDSITDNNRYFSGAGLYIGAVSPGQHVGDVLSVGQAGPSFTSSTLNDVWVENNHIDITSTQANAAVSGGGLYMDGTDKTGALAAKGDVTFIDVTAYSNSAKITGAAGTTASSAQGGGIRLSNVKNLDYQKGFISYNKVININGSTAHGGGMSFGNNSISGKIDQVTFNSNSAYVSGTAAGADAMAARGGGLYVINEHSDGRPAGDATKMDIKNSSFEGNVAMAEGNNFAQGGGFAMLGQGEATFTGVSFKGNKAESTGSGQYAQALGGAIYAGNFGDKVPIINIVNSRLEGNQAQAGTSGKAFGGAIFMDTAGTPALGGPITLNLEASTTADETIISGNTANGKADGVYFGSNNGTSAASGLLNIAGAGTVKLIDPVTALMGGKDFTFTKNNTGKLFWGGTNVLDAGNGATAYVNLTDGETFLGDSFTVNSGGGAGALNVDLTGGNIAFDASRSTGLAMFDFSKGATGSFAADGTTVIGIQGAENGGRQILNAVGSYVLASNTTADSLTGSFTSVADGGGTEMTAGNGVSGFEVDANNNLLVKVNYLNPEQGRIKASGSNSWSGRYALQELVSAKNNLITDEQFQVIRNNYQAVTPEYGMVQGRVGLDSTGAAFDKARQSALNSYYSSRKGETVPSAGGYYGFDHTVRAWAGYIGNFQNTDNQKGYLGYDAATHGGLIGINYDASEHFSVGVFGGSTKTDTDLNKIKSEIESDGTHIGVMAAASPIAEYPALGLYFDLGYSSYDNDGYRMVGSNKIKATFDQEVYTAGLGFEHIFNFNEGTLLTPYLNLRYSHLKQDGFKEKGGLTASKINGYSADSINSLLGVKLSREFEINTSGCDGSFTPYVNVGWKHEFGDLDFKTKSAYINPNGGVMSQSFNISGVSADRDALSLGTGGELMFNTSNGGQAGITVDYNFQSSKNQDSHSIYSGFAYRF